MQDKFFFSPIFPGKETSINGTFLISATMNKFSGLVNKLDGGKFGLDINVLKWKALVYGDALSCITHRASRLVIAKKGTLPGNDKLVSDLLGAHSLIIIQKGLFYQCLHQASAIYTKYYGGFMQAIQVELSVKRVNGIPERSYYQDHDKFLQKLYRACRRSRFAKFIESLTAADLEEDRHLVSGRAILSLEERMNSFYTS